MATATNRTDWQNRLDRLAISLSALCAVHCLASAVLLALLSAAGGLLLHPLFHEIGLALAILLGAIALGGGVVRHRRMVPAVLGTIGLGIMVGALAVPHDGGFGEVFLTIMGVAILALGHALNRRAIG